MKPADYMNRERFPLTFSPDYSLKDQLQIDSFNHQVLKDCIRDRRPLTSRQWSIWRELEQKRPHIKPLMAEIEAAERLAPA